MRYQVDLDDYKTELCTEAWELARFHMQKAQKRQKKNYDRYSKPAKFSVGDRVFVHMPKAKEGRAHKFAHPFFGPYRILNVTATNVQVRPA